MQWPEYDLLSNYALTGYLPMPRRKEFHSCSTQKCGIRRVLMEGYVAFWPLEYKGLLRTKPASNQMLHRWRAFIRPTEETGSHQYLEVCEKHHSQILAMFELEMQADVVEQEQTEKYAARMGGRF